MSQRVGTEQVTPTKLGVFCRTEVYEKTARPRTFSPGDKVDGTATNGKVRSKPKSMEISSLTSEGGSDGEKWAGQSRRHACWICRRSRTSIGWLGSYFERHRMMRECRTAYVGQQLHAFPRRGCRAGGTRPRDLRNREHPGSNTEVCRDDTLRRNRDLDLQGTVTSTNSLLASLPIDNDRIFGRQPRSHIHR